MAGKRQAVSEEWNVDTYTAVQPDDTSWERVRHEKAGWRVTYSVEAVKGRPAVSAIALEPVDDTRIPPLPAGLVRDLFRPAYALELVRLDRASDTPQFLARHGLDAKRISVERGKRQPDYLYAVIAATYVAQLDAGNLTSPVAATSNDIEAAGHKGYERRFIRDALTQARRRKLLTWPEASRRASGKLTARGRQVLKAGPPDGYKGPLPLLS